MHEEYYELDFWVNLEEAVHKLQRWNREYKNRKAYIDFNVSPVVAASA